MERLAIVSHKSFSAIGFNKSRSPSSPYRPAPQGSQLITLQIDPKFYENLLKCTCVIVAKQASFIWSYVLKVSPREIKS